MITISLCMIVKNEEQVLERCLRSCGNLFDEIVIVDTGSTDTTKQIASKFTSNIYDFEWVDDFSRARNFAFSMATGEYLMWLDADDVLMPEDLSKLRTLKKVLSHNVDAVMMKYRIGLDQKGRASMTYYRERLVKRASGFRWLDPVHEYIPVTGNISSVDIAVTHQKEKTEDPNRNLRIYQRMIANEEPFSSRNTFYYARELADHGMAAEAAEQYEKFLGSSDGWVEDYISACYELSYCYEKLNNSHNMISALVESFRFSKPRAEICCRIGDYHRSRESYHEAAFWYELALSLEKPSGWGFVQEDYWGYIPAMQLCVCYYNLGDLKASERCNTLAKSYKPDDPGVISNEKFFLGARKK
ncbi:MAG TPA: glycosyltransferase family 2 protein [Clostridia bacterium]|nr:glycosyltransferase family 2 protein [Clostridia bacterium]